MYFDSLTLTAFTLGLHVSINGISTEMAVFVYTWMIHASEILCPATED